MIATKKADLIDKKQLTTAFNPDVIRALDFVCQLPSTKNENILQSLFNIEISLQVIKHGNDMHGSIVLSTFHNFLYVKQEVACIPYLLQNDFFPFLLQKISSNFVHLSYRKNAIKLLRLIMDLYPPITDHLIQLGLFVILEELLPDTAACDCIKTLMKNSENLRQSLIQNQFQRKILSSIQTVDQIFSTRTDYFIKNYVMILDVIRIFHQFDSNDYDSFLTFFVRYFTNISAYGSEALNSFLLFLNSSDDLNLMNIFMIHPLNIVEKILIHFDNFQAQKFEFIKYIQKIIIKIPEYSEYLCSPIFLNYYISIISKIDTLYGDFNIFFSYLINIMQISYQNLNNIFTRDLFFATAAKFEAGEFDVKNGIFQLYVYILFLPSSSNFLDNFFQILNSIVEYIGIILSDEGDDDVKLMIINLIMKILTESSSTNINFFERFMALLQSPEFQDILCQLTIDENEKISEHAALLEDTIEKLLEK